MFGAAREEYAWFLALNDRHDDGGGSERIAGGFELLRLAIEPRHNALAIRCRAGRACDSAFFSALTNHVRGVLTHDRFTGLCYGRRSDRALFRPRLRLGCCMRPATV